ncbi:hypothetical protein DEJ36_01080 [Curtobacterium sp. MCPF17_052]|nr:hypothetical protein [Curtobacterium sp. MCPF17_052]WIB14042.1 hypothetical protein DEJ36_01080 [Curtobacterium sp. MCPF17_052]
MLEEWGLGAFTERSFGGAQRRRAEAGPDRPCGDDRPRGAVPRRAGSVARPGRPRESGADARRLRAEPGLAGDRHRHPPRRGDPGGLHARARPLRRPRAVRRSDRRGPDRGDALRGVRCRAHGVPGRRALDRPRRLIRRGPTPAGRDTAPDAPDQGRGLVTWSAGVGHTTSHLPSSRSTEESP